MNYKINLKEYSSLEIYKMVLNGTIETFPKKFWNNKDNVIILLNYLLKDILNWGKEDIKKGKLNLEVLAKYKLKGMMKAIFDESTYNLINFLYPNEFKPWEITEVPQNYWKNKNNIKKAIIWLIEEKFNWSKKDVIKFCNTKLLNKYGMSGILNDYTLFEVIDLVYPGVYLKWDFFMGNWYDEDYLEAIKWFIEIKLHWNKEEIIENLTTTLFVQNRLSSIVPIKFKNSYEAMKFAYPEENWDELKEKVLKRSLNKNKVPKCKECKYCVKNIIVRNKQQYLCIKNNINKYIFYKEFMARTPKWCPKRT